MKTSWDTPAVTCESTKSYPRKLQDQKTDQHTSLSNILQQNRHTLSRMTTYYIDGICEAEKYDVEWRQKQNKYDVKNKTIGCKKGKLSFLKARYWKINGKENGDFKKLKDEKYVHFTILNRTTRNDIESSDHIESSDGQCIFLCRRLWNFYNHLLHRVSLNWRTFWFEKLIFDKFVKNLYFCPIFSLFLIIFLQILEYGTLIQKTLIDIDFLCFLNCIKIDQKKQYWKI